MRIFTARRIGAFVLVVAAGIGGGLLFTRTPDPAPEERAPASAEAAPSPVAETSRVSEAAAPPRRTDETPARATPSRPRRLAARPAAEIAKEKRVRESFIRKYVSRAFLTEKTAKLHWLEDVSAALSEQTLPKSADVVIESNGMFFFENPPGAPAPLGESTVYQAIYDSKMNRIGVVTGIVVLGGETELNPAALAAAAGIRHSSSRPETGLHFFHLPEGGVAAAGAALEKLNAFAGVQKAYLATQYGGIKGL